MLWLLLAELCCVGLQFANANQADPTPPAASDICENTTREIRIGFLGPYNSPNADTENVDVLPVGFLAAVGWMNDYCQFGGPNVTVVPVMLDSSRVGNNSMTRAIRNADQLLKCSSGPGTGDGTCDAQVVGHNVDAVIADQYSSTVSTIGHLAEIYGKPMVGYGATSDVLSNKFDYPYFSRVVAPDRYQAPYLAKVAHSFGWRHVGIFNGDGSYASGFASAFARVCASLTTDGVPDPVVVEERQVFQEGDRDITVMNDLLGQIKASGVKIILLASANYADTNFILGQADALGMTQSDFIWTGGDGWMSADDFKGEGNQLKNNAHGTVGIFHYVAEPGDSGSGQMVHTANTEMYRDPNRVNAWRARANEIDQSWSPPDHTDPSFQTPYDAWGYYVWDATVHTVRALASISDDCFANGTCARDAIRDYSSYTGATGDIRLNGTTGDRSDASYVIYNVQKEHSDILVPIGKVTDGNVVLFPDVEIIWPNGARGLHNAPSDGDWDATSSTAIDTELAMGLGLGFGVPIVLLLGFLHFYRKKKIKRSREKKALIAKAVKEKDALRKELDELQESMQSMMEVKTPWAGIGPSAARLSAQRSKAKPALIKETVQEEYYRWYWEEDKGSLHLHNKFMVKAPCWVEYAGSVAGELEDAYQRWKDGTGAGELKTDLAERISTTGTEQKASNSHTGTKFTINFAQMSQCNDKSGFKRSILRDVLTRSVTHHREAKPGEESYSDVSVDVGAPPLVPEESIVSTANDGEEQEEQPLDFELEDSLPLSTGQLIQVHKKRSDGYWHGSILYDADNTNADISDNAGWFPGINLTKATPELVKKFQAAIGGKGADALSVPDTWSDQPDKLHAQMFDVPLNSPEAMDKISQWKETLGASPPRVISLHRIQNVPMWQSFAVKKITMMNRANARPNWEKRTLFHGTDEDTAKKIMQQGFNRNFSGLNATFYGKGVYFARDASYSSSKTYARPNAAGVQVMFLCRVLVGEYCRGKKDVKAPDVLDAATNRLYDTTVDNMSSPGIFVTYHDAQVYPEYLIQFKQ